MGDASGRAIRGPRGKPRGYKWVVGDGGRWLRSSAAASPQNPPRMVGGEPLSVREAIRGHPRQASGLQVDEGGCGRWLRSSAAASPQNRPADERWAQVGGEPLAVSEAIRIPPRQASGLLVGEGGCGGLGA